VAAAAHVVAGMSVDQVSYPVGTVRVQVCWGVPSSEDSWEEAPWIRYDGGSEGINQAFGDATLSQVFGYVLRQDLSPGYVDVGPFPDIAREGDTTPMIGKLVRLVVTRPTGSEEVFWTGAIVSERLVPDGRATSGGGLLQWGAEGLLSILAQVFLGDGAVKPRSGGGWENPMYLPPFNGIPGGDRSSATVTIAGRSVYCHDLSAGWPLAGGGFPWTARQAADHILALVEDWSTAGLLWQISDPGGVLSYTLPKSDWNGASAADALLEICALSRGITLRPTISGGTVTLNVDTTVPVAITGGDGYTLPACAQPGYVDVRDNAWFHDLSFESDEGSTYDAIIVRSARPWYGLTVALVLANKAWDASAESTWDDDPTDSSVEEVYRRFQLLPTWDQQQYGATGDGVRDLSADDGDRTWSSSLLLPTAALKLERTLPCAQGFTGVASGPRQAPVIVEKDGTTYTDRSLTWRIELDDQQPLITLDDGKHGTVIDALLAGGGSILVSLGLRAVVPLQVYWERSSADWPRPVPRVKVIDLPEVEEWIVLKGTLQGVDPVTGALYQLGADVTVRDEVGRLTTAMAQARGLYEQPAHRISYSWSGGIDTTAAGRPGVLWRTLTTGDGVRTLEATVTRRQWSRGQTNDGVPIWRTSFQAESLRPNLGAIR
jgi:hypothetical protein